MPGLGKVTAGRRQKVSYFTPLLARRAGEEGRRVVGVVQDWNAARNSATSATNRNMTAFRGFHLHVLPLGNPISGGDRGLGYRTTSKRGKTPCAGQVNGPGDPASRGGRIFNIFLDFLFLVKNSQKRLLWFLGGVPFVAALFFVFFFGFLFWFASPHPFIFSSLVFF